MSEQVEPPPVHKRKCEQSTAVKSKPRNAPTRIDRLPPWDVLLHNDDLNDMGYVIETILMLTTLKPECAIERMFEAHRTGVAMLLNTHKEHAELLQEQFMSKGLKVTIEAGC
ncbi:MAG: ATP-dependent Clp protease adaptor ClpS [Planctomycetota bacterium]|nr:ATP-dependent Clp protease adaptor ClpS [Planctomycetota bacterium]